MSAIFTRRTGLVVPAASEEFSPEDVSGLQGWWKADAIVQADNSAVATWPGSTGARDLTQAVGADQPTLQTNEVNGLPVVRFVNDNLGGAAFSTFATASAFSIFFAFKSTFGGVETAAPLFADVDGYIGLYATVAAGGGAYFYNYDAGDADVAVAVTANQWAVLSAQHSGGNIRLRLDGGTDDVTASGDTEALAGTVQVGAFAMDVGEILVYNTAVSAPNRTAIEEYLADRWQ